MSIKIPTEGQVQLLNDLLGGGSLENWTLSLFATAHTPAVTDTKATFDAIKSTFTGYADKTLTRSLSGSTWSTPGLTGSTIDPTNHDAKSTYGSSPFSWSATSAQNCYGYYFWGATSTKCIGAEAFASTVSLINPSTLTLQNVLELGSN